MILADTHCHLYFSQFQEDIDQVLSRSVDAGVTHIFLPAIDFETSEELKKLHHPEITFYPMAGIHPGSVEKEYPINYDKLLGLCQDPSVVGVGETGLDYYWSTKFVNEQKESLRMHCEIAKKTGKPIVLHNRESTSDLLDIIEHEQDGSLKGVWHCFTGSFEEGKRALDLGLFLGIGGIATFKNAGVDNVAAKLPLDRMLLETDAPFLAPTPYRGKRNEPAYVKIIAEHLAKLKNIPAERIAETTSKNSGILFNQNIYG